MCLKNFHPSFQEGKRKILVLYEVALQVPWVKSQTPVLYHQLSNNYLLLLHFKFIYVIFIINFKCIFIEISVLLLAQYSF